MPILLQGNIDAISRRILALTEINVGDAAALVEIKRADILQTTGRGLDANDQALAPYSDKGPVYIDLGGRSGSKRSSRASKVRASRNKAALRGRKVTPFGSMTPGGRLKAKSYKWFKESWLGRSAVDLIGVRAPHMMQSIVSRVTGRTAEGVRAEIGFQNPEKEEIARGHQEGAGDLPRRRFWEWGRNDKRELTQRWLSMIRDRLRR